MCAVCRACYASACGVCVWLYASYAPFVSCAWVRVKARGVRIHVVPWSHVRVCVCLFWLQRRTATTCLRQSLPCSMALPVRLVGVHVRTRTRDLSSVRAVFPHIP